MAKKHSELGFLYFTRALKNDGKLNYKNLNFVLTVHEVFNNTKGK
jgi:hypothetical protein